MGLTIHYSLKAGVRTFEQAKALVRDIHAAASEWPFDYVGPVIDVPEGTILPDFPPGPPDVRRHVPRGIGFAPITVDGDIRYEYVKPIEHVAFVTDPGGSEWAEFGLARYPATVDMDGRDFPSGLNGWRWRGFCKTQYASDPNHGGIRNFLRCHLGLVHVLDRAKELGILDHASDEGNYWEKRDLAALVREVSRWNTAIAGIVGRMQDDLEKAGLDRNGIVAAIKNFPDFERLEAEGRNRASADEEGEEGL